MLDIARRFNVTRIKKCCQIMGRLEGNLTAAQVLYVTSHFLSSVRSQCDDLTRYPLMQCTDVFFLKADVCQLVREITLPSVYYCNTI